MKGDDADEVCQIAKNLARNCGYAVHPVRADKVPASPHGFEDASKLAADIEELWHRFPAPLIGIRTGEPSGIDVLDIDVQHPAAVAWHAAAAKRLPPTRTYATRRGGHHLYFKHADGIRNSQSKVAFGVDVRGDGGFIICWYAAGYDCEDHSPPAPWPAWLLECVTWKPEPVLVDPSARLHNTNAAIDGLVRFITGAQQGERNSRLHWAARRFAGRVQNGNISRSEATRLLITAARAVGLGDREAERTISSAWRAP